MLRYIPKVATTLKTGKRPFFTMAITPAEVTFNKTDRKQAYDQALVFIAQSKNSKIKEKESGVYIKGNIGSPLKARMMGVRNMDNWPIEVMIDFAQSKIKVSDAFGPAMKAGMEEKVNSQLKKVAEDIRQAIEA